VTTTINRTILGLRKIPAFQQTGKVKGSQEIGWVKRGG
jgi:hypothetical protein